MGTIVIALNLLNAILGNTISFHYGYPAIPRIFSSL